MQSKRDVAPLQPQRLGRRFFEKSLVKTPVGIDSKWELLFLRKKKSKHESVDR